MSFQLEKCIEKQDLMMDDLPEDGKGVVVIQEKRSDLSHCYLSSELLQSFKSRDIPIVEWDNREKQVYKLPHGPWIDQDSALALICSGLQFFKIKDSRRIKIGSEFGVSRLHGAEEIVLSLVPVDNNGDELEAKIDSNCATGLLERNDSDGLVEFMENETLNQVVFEEGGSWEDIPMNIDGILKISDKSITEIPPFPNLRELQCTKCRDLQLLPELPSLEILICTNSGLQRISDLPRLQEIYCDGSRNLRELSNLPNLAKIQCKGTAIREISNFPNLIELYCSEIDNEGENNERTYLEKVSNCPLLEQIYLDYCEFFQTLENLPSLVEIYFYNTNVNSISNLPKLDSISCKFSSVREIKNLPLLTYLNCANCQNLKTISGLQMLEQLDCSDCTNIEKISNLPQLNEFSAKSCTSLKEVSGLPELTHFDCDKCYSLKILDIPARREFMCKGEIY